MRRIPMAVFAALLSMCLPLSLARAADSAPASVPADPQYAQAVAAIKAHQYDKAIPMLQAYARRSPPDADVHNLLGYAYRKTGKLEPAFDHYKQALALDPKHRAAHEYIGEAYLMANNLPKAEEHLKILDGLCTLSCEEYRDLKKAVADYKARSR
ncbi:MAG: tetratricopeptide repeat protein [Pseudomonadota bacterium]